MMDEDLRRLEKIRESRRVFSEKLTYGDLCLLLMQDKNIQSLIAQAVAAAESGQSPVGLDTTIPNIASMHKKSEATLRQIDTLRVELAQQLKMLEILAGDEELQTLWLGKQRTSDQIGLVKMIATAANWDRVLDLWDIIAERCKKENRVSSNNEKEILLGAINIHNSIWQGMAAVTLHAEEGDKYDYNKHMRSNNAGEIVSSELLFGICNAAQTLQRQPVVRTR
ncbi:hypothetical protein V8J88_12940 [Massilia sp. W12]|uniref:hypothetical protein n=1 Tax=Massilia sp. W12 TaxID=3126507 RepID=UPI0030CCB4F5